MSRGEREHLKRTPMDFYTSQCGSKISHDKASATDEAERMSRKHHQVFKAYYCTFCHKWHVGKIRRMLSTKHKRKSKNNSLRSLYRNMS
jgi:hypothetical protein